MFMVRQIFELMAVRPYFIDTVAILTSTIDKTATAVIMIDQDVEFMKLAVEEAIKGVNANKGGPFGAVIVKNGHVIATGCNQVSSTKDITAHAEIVAIRNATAKLGTYDLSGCQIYASCHPCPMCLGAIPWSRFDGIYYAAGIKEAAENGFDSGPIYDFWVNGSPHLVQIPTDDKLKPFVFWKELLATITDSQDPRKILK